LSLDFIILNVVILYTFRLLGIFWKMARIGENW
jgi:hypothetical protein